ncbi:hypothetical protein [Leifsonia sp. RAF41]|uniref:hypothetical protein n=1 Tax=Leifsonia sp. RAF41 TaxID=3233056 RepID=UPI003F98A855
MSSLLDKVIDAHGGSRWSEVKTISAIRSFGGALWELKQVPGIAEHGRFTVDLTREWTSLQNFGDPDVRTEFTPDRVALVRGDNEVIEELTNPRASFDGHELTTPWSKLQAAYFTGYAMWTYNTEPWSFTFPGVVVEETGTWTENGETFDRLQVTYPSMLATHSPTQTLYADSDGILRRRDYDVLIMGGNPAVEYMTGQTEVGGLILPTDRSIFVRDEEGHAVPEPLIVSINISDITVE